MTATISEYFRTALVFLLEKQGRGSQSRLAGEQGIDRGYLNGIIKGRKPASDDIRVKIASHFDNTYEEMLALGRQLKDKENGSSIDPSNETQQNILINKEDTDKSTIPSTETHPIPDSGLLEDAWEAADDSKVTGATLSVANLLKSKKDYDKTLLKFLTNTIRDTEDLKNENKVLKVQIIELEKRIEKIENR